MVPRAPLRRPPLPRWSSNVSRLLLCLAMCGASPGAARARPGALQGPVILDVDDRLGINNLDMAFTNYGCIACDFTTFEPGLLYPRGATSGVVYAAGLWLGAKVNGSPRLAIAEYVLEYVPGPMPAGDPAFERNYRIDRGGGGYQDYLQHAVPQGAPVDVNGDPLLLGDALVWSVFNDADAFSHQSDAGSTAPLGVEVQQSVFAFSRSGALGDVIFVKWRLANKGGNQLDSMFVSMWADPDVGGFTDDLVGCDTTRSLGYAYNGDNTDDAYGSTPPAVGFHLLQGPIAQGDTLGMTSFVKYVPGSDPMNAQETYLYMKGRRADGSPTHVCDDPQLPITTYDVSGLDPGASPSCITNWIDAGPTDRRFLLSSGPFSMAPGDTQVVVYAIEVGRSTDRIASIQALKATADVVSIAYGLGGTTAVEAFLVESRADVDGVRLGWRVSEPPGSRITVERRTESTAWIALAELTIPADRLLRFEDVSVLPGERYGYRLAIGSGETRDHSSESWIDVPLAPGGPEKIRLLPGHPNPSSASFRIDHYVPRAGTYRLSVLDVHGRLIRTLEDRALAPGWRASSWDGRNESGAEAASGVYVFRFEGEGESAVQKVVLMR